MKTIFIGIDISKDTLDVAVQEKPGGKPVDAFVVENSLDGIQKMVKRVKKLNHEAWYCFEHTGNYGYLLCHQLSAIEQKYSVVPGIEISRSQGLVRGKTDAVDAVRIANYACTHQHKLEEFKLQSEQLRKIKEMLSYRNQKSRMLRQYKNSLKSHKITGKILDNDFIIRDIESSIEMLKKDIADIEAMIMSLIKQDESLSVNFAKVKSVIGIGPIIAAYLIVYTNNFTSFDNPRKFNSYSGIAPFEYSSGTSIRGKTRTSKYRNKMIKSLLFNGANAAANYDPELRAYYKRKKEEGKPRQLIMNNIACKLVYRAFAVVKRDELFVKLVR